MAPRNQNGNNHTSSAVAVEGIGPPEPNRTTLPPPHPHQTHFAPTQPNHFMPPRHLTPSNPPFQHPHPYSPPNPTFRRPPFPPPERPPYIPNTHPHIAPLCTQNPSHNGVSHRHSECSEGRGKSRYHPYPSPNHPGPR